MKLDDTIISSGGLFRCCIQTILDLNPETEYTDGTILDCKFEKEGNKNIVLKNGKWEWNNSELETIKEK
jgi:hypothetical protein